MKKILNTLVNTSDDRVIEHLSENSKDIVANTLFFCLTGVKFDGHTVVDEVISKGATAIVHTKDIANKNPEVCYIQVDDIDLAIAKASTEFFDNPSHKMEIMGITGTNGKTTTSWLLFNLLNKFEKSGYIGTVAVAYNDVFYPAKFTTPKAIELNSYLAEMAQAQVTNCSMEISSHALVQKRSNFIDVKYGVMTNLTHEHVNYHGSMEQYAADKGKLFEQLAADSYAILNVDDATYEKYAEITNAKVIRYGIENEADVFAKNIELTTTSSKFTLSVFGEEYQVETNLVAIFNIYNLLAAITVIALKQYDLSQIIPLLTDLKLPEGRMEYVDEGQDFDVIVDFAHTPDGQEKVMEYAHRVAKGRVISVFGSAGGDRDAEKRPVMGEIADKYCDEIILTQDDNRTDSVQKICDEIIQGIEQTNYVVIEDRPAAIKQAITMAKTGDIVLILGKGHEATNRVADGEVFYGGDIPVSKEVLRSLKENENEKTN